MKLTVREVLQITPLKEAKVLAGERALDREVRNVNVVEVPDTVRWMRGGEIMFSGGFAFSGDGEKGCALLASLNSHNISALVLKPGIYMSKVPEQMIAYAEKIGFPLLEVPSTQPFNVYIEAIYALLLDKRTYLFNLDSEPYHFSRATSVVSGELSNICNILVERIKAPVLYLALDGIVEQIIGSRYYQEGEAEIPQQKPIEQWMQTHSLVQICVEMEPRAYLATPKRGGFPSETDLAMMEYTAMLIATELQKEQAFIEQKKKYRSTLLHDLISKNFGDRNMLRRRCELLQFRLDDPFFAFAVCTASDGTPEGDRRNLTTTRNYICSVLEHSTVQNACSLLLSDDQELILGVLSTPDQPGVDKLARQLLEEMLQNLRAACKNIRVTVGMSTRHTGVEQVAHAVQEAQEALTINARLSTGTDLACLDDLGIYRILCELKSTQIMQEFFERTLHNILETDNAEELLRTLERYYANECNLRKTADELFLHKNSVKYRLSRIEQLLGYRITEPEAELNLKLCLKYRKIL